MRIGLLVAAAVVFFPGFYFFAISAVNLGHAEQHWWSFAAAAIASGLTLLFIGLLALLMLAIGL